MSDGMLVIISGPSGSGKGTVVKQLKRDGSFALSISMTTRAPREGETDGRDYFFTTKEEFASMRENNELLEHALYVGNYYGTPRKYVQEQISQGKVVVLEIEVSGALQVKEKFPQAILIFLMPPTLAELERRLVNRKTEDSETIARRLNKASEELDLLPRYNYLVVNDKVEDAVGMIQTIVSAERLKPERGADLIRAFREG